MLFRTTFTGYDCPQDDAAANQLQDQFPFVELGILYHTENHGSGRYPSLSNLEHFVQKALRSSTPRKYALHLCGVGANRKFIEGQQLFPFPLDWKSFSRVFGRVQMNINLTKGPFQLSDLKKACDTHPQQLIVQYNQSNSTVATLSPDCDNLFFLFDASGGRGTTPQQWTEGGYGGPADGAVFGYAGGLSPDNIAVELPKIHAVSGGAYWIDMESKVRDELDRFDLGKCQRVAAEVRSFIVKQYVAWADQKVALKEML